jgi:hypothetical protein
MNRAEGPEPYMDIGITAAQYHAGLDKLWKALNGNKNGVDDVFTMCANRIKELESQVKELEDDITEYAEAQPPI